MEKNLGFNIVDEGYLEFENAKILFKNFEGRETKFKKAGDKTFSIVLTDEGAKYLEARGWNVKWPKAQPDRPDEQDTRNATLPIGVRFDFFPAEIYLITLDEEGRVASKVQLGEDQVAKLDWSEFKEVDVTIRPHHWEFNKDTGIKAQLAEGYFVMKPNRFARKYDL